MKKLVFLFTFIFLVSCASPFKGISSDNLTYSKEVIFYKGKKVAKLSSMELAYDDKKIIREVTFTLLKGANNDLALPILKLLHELKPEWEVEVELKH